MTIVINDRSHHAAAGLSRALSPAIRAEALADEIDALHRGICAGLPCITPARWMVIGKHGHVYVICDGHALTAPRALMTSEPGLGRGCVTDRLMGSRRNICPGCCPRTDDQGQMSW